MTKVFSMGLEELMNTKVNIATKSDKSINETPGVVSVITSEEIKNMGARELEDVLQIIPGFEITRLSNGYYGIGIRGVKDPRASSKLLMMVDGVPFNEIFYGQSIRNGYDVNIDIIERIEIIRGPGSALYGRNAFSGVMNIITKNAKNNEKSFVKLTAGTFNTKILSGYYGYKNEKINASFSFRRLYTDVTDQKFDNGMGDTVLWNIYRNNFTASATIGYGNFMFSGTFFDLDGGAIFNDNRLLKRTGNFSLSYNKKINPRLSFDTKIYSHNEKYTEDFEGLKPGILPKYPKGIYYKPVFKEYLYGIETEMNYKLSSTNDLLFGIQMDIHGAKDVAITTNYNFAVDSAIYNLVDSPLTRNNQILWEPGWFVNNGHQYNNLAFFAQDIWYATKELCFTLGARYDIDSQIGGVFNPRVGIVWEPFNQTYLKLLYGKAYRAPAPSEQYQTLGFAFGNTDLKPEIINTFEISLSQRLNRMTNTVSLFKNKLKDMIYAQIKTSVSPNNTYYNMGKNNSMGLEFENKFIFRKNIYSYFNYSYTVSENTQTTVDNRDSIFDQVDVAPHKINLGLNYSFLNHYNCNLNMFYRSTMGKFKVQLPPPSNELMDVQDKIGNFAVFNFVFQMSDLIKNFTFTGSVYNVFNTYYYSQDNANLRQPHQPGRQFLINVTYAIK
jgi:iron complex outermembrane receptor protein